MGIFTVVHAPGPDGNCRRFRVTSKPYKDPDSHTQNDVCVTCLALPRGGVVLKLSHHTVGAHKETQCPHLSQS